MCNTKIEKRIKLFRTITAAVFIASLLIPLPALAAPLKQQSGNCQVLLNQYTNGWSTPVFITFDRCAGSVAQYGQYDYQGFAYGVWAGVRVSVTKLGEVYYLESGHNTWQYWGRQTVSQDTDRDSILDASDRCPNQPETYNNFAETDGCPDSLNDLVITMQQDLDNFWRQAFSTVGSVYRPPNRLVIFDQWSASRTRSECKQIESGDMFYCLADRSIYLDLDQLNLWLSQKGDYAAAVAIAHEWAHMVQHQLGRLSGSRYTFYEELEADCLAGAYTRASKLIEPGDIEEGAYLLAELGDYLHPEHPQAHGSPEQRWGFFQRGVQYGLDACNLPM